MDNTFLIAAAVLHVLAIVDVWTSKLTRAAKILWSVNLVFLLGVGLAAWLLTRHTAHRPMDEAPAAQE